MNREKLRKRLADKLKRSSKKHMDQCETGLMYRWYYGLYEPVHLAGRIRSIMRRLRICPMCRGSGKEWVTDGDEESPFYEQYPEYCYRCDGTGIV